MKRFGLLVAALALGMMLASLPAWAQGLTSGTVDSNGATIAYRVQGSGPAMMLVHGYPLSGELFAKNRDALAKKYTVVTPDLRGFGDSTAPNDDGSVEIYAKDMIAVMDKLNIQKAIIGGMSMGGPVVFEMYREAPQRFNGLIMIDTTAAPASYPEQGQWPGFGKQAQEKGVDSMVPLLLPAMLTGQTRAKDAHAVDFLGFIVKKGTVNGAVGGGKTLANRPDSMDTLKSVTVPVLIIGGVADGIYPFEMQRMAHEAVPGSKLLLVPGAAHAAIYEKADVCNKAILAWAKGIK